MRTAIPIRFFDTAPQPGKYFVASLVLAQIGFIIPIMLEEYLIAFMLLFGIIALFFVYNEPTNGLIVLPLFLHMPVEIPGFGGVQFSEIGTFLVILSLLLGMLVLKQNFELEAPALIPLVLILTASCLSIINANYFFASVKNIIKFVEAFIIVFWLTVNMVLTKKTILKIFNSFMIAGVLATFIGIYRFLQGYETRVFGLLGAGFGAYIGISGLIALNIIIFGRTKIKRVIAFLLLSVFISGLILSQTRAWLLATLIAALFVFMHIGNFKKALKFSVISLLLVTLVYSVLTNEVFFESKPEVITTGAERAIETGFGKEDAQQKYVSILMRIFLWIHGFSLYMQNPIFGFGIGNLRFKSAFTGELGAPSDPFVGYVDNHWLNVLYETGILGIIGWIALAIVIFKNCRKLLQVSYDPEWKLISLSLTGSMIIFLIGGLTWVLTVVHEMTVLIPFLMGLIFASLKIISDKQSQ